MKFYNIYDTVSGVYYGPYIAHNAGDAIRVIRALMSTLDATHPIIQHSADLRLFEIGHYYPETSVIEPIEPHRVVYTTLSHILNNEV